MTAAIGGDDPAYHTFAASLGSCSASKALVWASFGRLSLRWQCIFPRGIVKFGSFMEGCIEGMKLMLPANIILVLAWTLSGVLPRPSFDSDLCSRFCRWRYRSRLLPSRSYFSLLRDCCRFSTGTAWGTFWYFDSYCGSQLLSQSI